MTKNCQLSDILFIRTYRVLVTEMEILPIKSIETAIKIAVVRSELPCK